jgi:DNA polymerase-3 subunit delta
MNYTDIISDLKKKVYKPVYFLMGEEPYFIDQITDFIMQNILDETEKTFNLLVLYGKDTDIRNVITSARRFPMMARYQVIIVKEAQHLRNIEELQHYLAQPLISTILVINYKYKKIDKRTRFYKILSEKGVVFDSEKVYEDKLPVWISTYLKDKGIQIETRATSMLVDYLGNDISKIVNELGKLLLVLPQGSNKITSDLIEKNIGISKEFNSFELNRALAKRDILKANRIIFYFSKNLKNNPVVLIFSSLFYFFSKLLIYHTLKEKTRENIAKALGVNPYFVPEYQAAAQNYSLSKVIEIISLMREYDLKSKGSGSLASEGELLKELVYKIMH